MTDIANWFVFSQGVHSGFMKEPTAGEIEDIVRTTGLRSAWAIAEEAKRQQMEGREASAFTTCHEEETPQQRAAKQRAADAAMQKLLGMSPSYELVVPCTLCCIRHASITVPGKSFTYVSIQKHAALQFWVYSCSSGLPDTEQQMQPCKSCWVRHSAI